MIKAFISDPRCLTLNFKSQLQSVSRETRFDADIFILYQDYLNIEKIYMTEALIHKIPVLVIQHGRQATRDYSKEDRDLRAAKICLWGKLDYNRMRGLGYPSERLVITGCPLLENISKHAINYTEVKTIFFSAKYYPYLVHPNFDIVKILLRTPCNVIIKTIADDRNVEVYKQAQDQFPGRVEIIATSPRGNPEEHLALLISGLNRSDLVVGIEESINELIAEAMDIPVVMVRDVYATDQDCMHFNGTHDIMAKGLPYSKAVYQTKLKKLFNCVKSVIKNDHLKQERRDVAIEEGGLGLSVSKLIMNEINKLVKGEINENNNN